MAPRPAASSPTAQPPAAQPPVGATAPGAAPVEQRRLQLRRLTAESLHARLAAALGQPLPRNQDPGSPWVRFAIETGDRAPVMAAIHAASGEVQLVGLPEQLDSWSRIITALDAPAAGEVSTRAIASNRRSSAQVRQAVTTFVAQGSSAGAPGPGGEAGADDSILGPVQIDFIDGTDILLIRGNPQDVARVEEIIRQIEELTTSEPPELRVVPLEFGESAVMARLVTQIFSAEDANSLGSYYGTPLALPLIRPNALLLIGSTSTLDKAAEVLRELDVRTEEGSQIRVFRLTKAVAEDAATVLEDLFVEQDDEDAPLFRPRALVIADSRSNSVIVRAGPRDMEEMVRLVAELDQTADASGLLKVFPIENGDAVALVEMLDELFATTDQGQDEQTSVVQLRFAVDERTNSVIAFGSSEDLVVVEAILLRLDTGDSRQRKNFVYQLKNANAEDVAIALQESLEAERDVQQTAPGVASPFQQLEREVIVVPELASNSLIVSATPRAYQDIVQVIEELDRQAPMVMIQVLIGEVRLGDADEFGVELGLQDSVLFDRSLLSDLQTTTNVATFVQPGGAQNTVQQQIIQGAELTPGFNWGNPATGLPNSGSDLSLASAGKVAAQGLSSFALNRVNPDLGFGGLVLSASSNSISMLLRALQESRRLEVLSRPQIMALDGQLGTAFVGEQVPLITQSNIDQFGNPQNSVERVRVGLLLEVQPRISPDGLVVMRVNAVKSELGRLVDGVPVAIAPTGQPINQPRIAETSANTTVSAVSGQTIVLSGLLTKRDFALHRRVPLLADIPLLGDLFRFDSTSTERTELLIILTPQVVRSRAEAERIKRVESARMSWCLSDVVDMHGRAGLLSRNDPFGAAEAPVVYPSATSIGVEGSAPTPAEGFELLPSAQSPSP
jgi:type II secretion system protein D